MRSPNILDAATAGAILDRLFAERAVGSAIWNWLDFQMTANCMSIFFQDTSDSHIRSKVFLNFSEE